MTDGPNMLAQALLYAGAGINVFPVTEQKNPYTEHGFKDATTDRDQIEAWWRRWPDAGIATSDFDVVDVDLYKPGADDVWQQIKQAIPSSVPQTKTPRGGLQFFFQPHTLKTRKFADQIDLRYADRNYVLLPPSQFADYGRYEFVVKLVGRKLQPAPEFPDSQLRNGPAQPVGDKIPYGRQHYELVSLAGTMRRRGLSADEIYAALWQVNVNRCERPGPEQNIRQIAESVAAYAPEPRTDEAPSNGVQPIEPSPAASIVIEPLRDFLERDLPVAEALIGLARNGTNLLPRFGWVLPWGREGSGKTSILVDLLFHAAAGADWQHYPVARPLRIVAVINEGIPGGLQDKLAQKLELWKGDRDAVLDNLAVYASPWGEFTFRSERIVAHARDYAHDFGADYVALDPLHTLGTSGSGTPAETEEFKHRLRDFGLWDNLGVITSHHSNKSGMVSGDWARHADTVLRLEKDGKNPATKLTLEKARPADPAELGVPMLLEWLTETMGYERRELDARELVSDDVLLERVRQHLATQRSPVWLTALTKEVQGDPKRLGTVVHAAIKSGELVDESSHSTRYRVRLARESDSETSDDLSRRAGSAQTSMDTEVPCKVAPNSDGRELARSAGELSWEVEPPAPERGSTTTTDDDCDDWKF